MRTKQLLVLSLLVGASFQQARAQGPVTGGPTPTPTADPTAVPLDGGASLLLAAGVGLGIKRLRAYRLR